MRPPVSAVKYHSVDSTGDKALRAIDEAVAEVAGLSGPVTLDEAYLRAIDVVEALPQNQSGTDKTWVWEAIERDRGHFARARRR
jgi:hypothetical protein